MAQGNNHSRSNPTTISIDNVDRLVQVPSSGQRPRSARETTVRMEVAPVPDTTGTGGGQEVKAPKYNLTKVPFHEILQKMEDHFLALWKKESFTNEIVNHLGYISECSRYQGTDGGTVQRQTIVQKMLDHGVVELFSKIWSANFDGFSLETENKLAYSNMKYIMFPLRNCSHDSEKVCQRILDSGVYRDLFVTYLNSSKFSPHTKRTASKQHLTRGIMGIAHNLLQNADAREPIRHLGAIDILMQFRDSYTNLIKIRTEILLAYLIDEEQNEQINSTDATFAYLIKVLKDCLANADHCSKTFGGYDAIEILRALHKLSANEKNKLKIVRNGALPLLTMLLPSEGNSHDERHSAATVLWSLAFSARDKVKEEPGCVEGLRILSEDPSGSEASRAAQGVLWVLDSDRASKIENIPYHEQNVDDHLTSSEEQKNNVSFGKLPVLSEERSSILKVTPSEAHTGIESSNRINKDPAGHIFISYQWSSQTTILLVRDKLRSMGFPVWLDVDNISGSILEAMALAVENASIVIVCLSQKYKESPNCRTEGEYAFRLGKAIVPLRLEPKYKADGWLGALAGNKLFFDISSEARLEENFSSFVKELKQIAPAFAEKESTSEQRESHVRIVGAPVVASTPHSRVERWDPEQVQRWFEQNNLATIKDRFSEFNGEMLLGLRTLMKEAPEYCYKALKDEHGFNLKDTVLFSNAFNKLKT